MITKELIKAKIDSMPEEDLDELYDLIVDFAQSRQDVKQSFLSQLQEIRIDGPEDFAANIDLYLNGEKLE